MQTLPKYTTYKIKHEQELRFVHAGNAKSDRLGHLLSHTKWNRTVNAKQTTWQDNFEINYLKNVMGYKSKDEWLLAYIKLLLDLTAMIAYSRTDDSTFQSTNCVGCFNEYGGKINKIWY